MAYATIRFQHPSSGAIRLAPVGFSWTMFFFGPLLVVYRLDWRGALIMILWAIPTLGYSGIVFPFIYNRMYVRHLIRRGFQVSGTSADPGYLASRLKLTLPMIAPSQHLAAA